MEKIIQIIKDHKWAILLAIVAAVIIAYPQIHLRLQDYYQGIERINASPDEGPWMARVKEVQDGHILMSNPYFKDAKNDPYLIQPLGSIIVAYLGKIFSLDLSNTILLSRLLFPFIVFLFIYAFVFLATNEKIIALTIPTALFLGNALFSRKGIFQILAGESPSTTYLSLTRPVNPALTWFFFFGFLLFFWLFLEKKQWRWGILSALTLGFSFYDYFYTWSFLYAFCGVLVIIFFLQKKWLDVKRIMIVLSASTLLAIPYFLNLYRIYNWPTYQEVAQRIGFFEGRTLILGFLVPLLFIIFLLFFPKQWKERYFYFLALIITPFVVLNQQFITGRIPMNAHYHWYFHLPLAIIFLLMMFFSWLSQKKLEFYKKTAAALIIIISISTGIFIQNSSYAANKDNIIERQKQEPIMEWFDENTQKEEVVFANNEFSESIVVYTSLNVFYDPTIKYLMAGSYDRLLESLFLFYRLNGLGREESQGVFFKERAEISAAIYGIYYRQMTGDEANIPNNILQEIVQKYQESFSLSTADFLNNVWSKYEVKYLVWDKKENPQWNLDQYLFLKKVAEIGDFVIYQK